MKTEVKLITPAIAEQLLKKNTMNRQQKNNLLIEYERRMICGLWREDTGEAIKISKNGNILDGQHRLLALIKSNSKLNFLVISDMEEDIFPVLDSGAKRTAGDVLYISGVSEGRNKAAGIRRYYFLKKGSVALFNAGRYDISSSEILSLYSGRKDFWDVAYEMTFRWYKEGQRVLSLSEVLGLYAFFFDISQDDAYEFMDSLSCGIDLNLFNPIKLLRDKLIFSRINKKFTLTNVQRTALIYKTWNLFREKQTVKYLKFNYNVENFPIPH